MSALLDQGGHLLNALPARRVGRVYPADTNANSADDVIATQARSHRIRTLAAKAGVSYVTVVRIEQGTMSPTVAMLTKLARALKVPITDLFPRPRQRR